MKPLNFDEIKEIYFEVLIGRAKLMIYENQIVIVDKMGYKEKIYSANTLFGRIIVRELVG